MPPKEEGTQHPIESALNNPEKDAARAEATDNVQSGDETYKASDRNALLARYKKYERKELKDLGVDPDEMDKALDELGKDEEEEEHELEGEQTQDETEESEGGDKEPAEEKVDVAEEEGDEPEPDAEEAAPLDIDKILSAKIPIKVDGVEGEATVEDLRKSYQLQGHLTRQLQEVAKTRNDLQIYAQQVQAAKAQMENEFKDYEEQLFSPEEIKVRQRERDRVTQEQRNAYSNQFLQCRTLLYQRHPDADQLDYDPAFVEFRQKEAPLVNEQMLSTYGPGVFFPAIDLLLTTYKKIKTLENELKGAKTAKDSLKTERVKELKAREAQQREQKKKTSADVKPSTSRVETGGDDSSDSDGGRNYVRKMKENRFRLQGLAPKSP
jgi:hypothetical protein